MPYSLNFFSNLVNTYQKTRKILLLHQIPTKNLNKSQLEEILTIGIVCKLGSQDKYQTFKNSLNVSLFYLKKYTLKLLCADASKTVYHSKVKSLFSKKNVEYDLLHEPYTSFPLRCYKLLEKTSTEFYFMMFDDQPVIGLTPDILTASCQLLKKYNGYLDLVLFDQNSDYIIDKTLKTISFDKNGSKLYKNKNKILFIEKINGCQFAICVNPRYGFFFNTLIVSRQHYSRRLKWYIKNISNLSPHKIELSTANKIKRGPVFSHIAISLDAFMVDIDISPSELSVRNQLDRDSNLNISSAINDAYKIEIE